MSQRKIKIPASLTSGQFATQEETLAILNKPNKMWIGIPKETSFQEKRISLTPSSVATLVQHGHRVMIETGAGEKSNYSDHDYSEVGGEIAYSKERVFQADILLKVAPPTLMEIDLLKPKQIIFSPIHLPTITEDYLLKLKHRKVIALAWEYIKDEENNFPIVGTLSELAGISAVLTAGELLTNSVGGRGVLLGGISGVPSTKVVILGAGVVAEYATRAALGMGADVRIFDNNIYKLKRLQNLVGQQLFTSAIIPRMLERELYTADVVIGAIHSNSGRAPVIVSEEMVSNMKEGAVIIDVSIDQGGCFATSQITTHDKPIFIKHGVIHYGVPNIASRVARTASVAVSNILTPILLESEQNGGLEKMFYRHAGLRHGVYVYKGSLTNYHLGDRFGMQAVNLDLILTSGL